jgi:hypothetical protein
MNSNTIHVYKIIDDYERFAVEMGFETLSPPLKILDDMKKLLFFNKTYGTINFGEEGTNI